MDAFTSFVHWFTFELLFSRNFLLINITLAFLNKKEEETALSLSAAKCLAALLARKGSRDERRPLLGLFEPVVLSQLLHAIHTAQQHRHHTELAKHLIRVLIGMGSLLAALWSGDDDCKPSAPQLSLFLKALFELSIGADKCVALDALQLWNTFLAHELMREDACVSECVAHFALMIAHSNSRLLYKQHKHEDAADEFDTEEDYAKFVHKFRGEVAKLIRQGASLRFDTFLANAFEWAVAVFNETNALSRINNLYISGVNGRDCYKC